MNRKFYQQSDYTHIYNFLKLKIPKWILFIPFASNAITFLLFTSLLDVKLTDRKLALKIRIAHNFFVVIFPLFLSFILIIATIVLAINYVNFNLEKYTFFSLFLLIFVLYLLLNPILLGFRNSSMRKKYHEIAKKNLIENPYNPTVINNWKKYLANYGKFYKGKAIYRAAENLKLSVDKPIIFNDPNIEHQIYGTDKEFENFYYSFHPFQMIMSKYFGSIFISTWFGYLFVLLFNYKNKASIDLKIKSKIFINWFINFIFGLLFISLGVFVSFVKLTIDQYFIIMGISIGLLFTYFIVAIIKMFIFRKIMNFAIMKFSDLETNNKNKRSFAINFLTFDQNDTSQKTLISNLFRINHYMIHFSIIMPLIISVSFIIIGFVIDVTPLYYVGFANLGLSLAINYAWVAFLIYLAKKINCDLIIKNKFKIFLFSPWSLFLRD